MSESPLLTAADIMIRNIVTVGPDARLPDAVAVLIRRGISGVPVVDDASGALLGLVTEYDCLRVLAANDYSDEGAEGELRVREIMSQAVKTIPPDMSLYCIAHELLDGRIRRLPVIEAGKLVGLVSRRDVLGGIQKMRRRRVRRGSARKAATGLYLSATGKSEVPAPRPPP